MRVWNKLEKNIPADAVYVGRPSKWGNPFKIGREYAAGNGHIITGKATRADVIALYTIWIEAQVSSGKLDLEELRGKDLVCWCTPKLCHADVLLRLANRCPEEKRE